MQFGEVLNMPATVTHAYFAKDVYEILPSSISEQFEFSRLKMFAQGVDSTMFYNLFSIFPGKDIRKFQKYFHTHKSQEFFIKYLQYMKDNQIHDKDTYAFLVGFLCHFCLDSNVHPYIFYKTGVMKKGYPTTYKYNNAHTFMEVFLDNDMIRRREKVNPYTFDFISYCFDTRPFSESLKGAIRYSFYNTFKIRDMDIIYYKSLKQMKTALCLFRRDPYGIKKIIYKMVDSITPRSVFRFEAISYHYPLEDRHNYLNRNHSLWRNPTTYNMTSNESFIDLYLKALKQAKVLICACFDYLDGKEIDLEQVIPNLSYVTGLDCNISKELKYFDF